MNTFDKLMELRAQYDELLEKEGENALKEAFKEFFAKHPSAHTITWTQYTPYFNDGDACHFSVHEMVLNDDEDEDYYDDDEDEDEDEDGEEAVEPEVVELTEEQQEALDEDFDRLQNIPEDVLEAVFGDHVQITATAEGFEVTEYSHD